MWLLRVVEVRSIWITWPSDTAWVPLIYLIHPLSMMMMMMMMMMMDDDDCCDCFFWNYFTTICATHNIWKLPSSNSSDQVEKNQWRPSRLTLFCSRVAELSLERNGEETRSARNPCLEISPFRFFVTHEDKGIGLSSSWIWLFDCVWKYVSSTRTLPASIYNMYNWH